MNKQIFLAALLLLGAPIAEAGRNTGVPECPAPNGNQYKIRDFTNYSPRGARGKMNGKCEQSNVYKDALDEKKGGPMKHGACHYELEDHLAGKTNAVMGAVPLKGRASNLLGAIYKGIALDKAIGVSGTFIYVGDTYGRGWHTGECKMDIITKAVKSPLTKKVNAAPGGELIKLARGDIPSPARKVPRDPGAMESIEPFSLASAPAVKAKKKKGRYVQLPDGKEAPIPVFRPTQNPPGQYSGVTSEDIDAYYDQRAKPAKKPAGQYSGTTTEDIDAYYDQFDLTPKTTQKQDRLKPKRKPASDSGYQEPSRERFGY